MKEYGPGTAHSNPSAGLRGHKVLALVALETLIPVEKPARRRHNRSHHLLASCHPDLGRRTV
jgi:hypothetical protein